MNRIFAAILTAMFVAVPAFSTFAQTGASTDDGVVSRTTIEVSNEVMSPFCPGKTLAMCPSPAAAEVRRDIQRMARDGMETEEIKKTLIEEYGDEFKIVEPGTFDNTVVFSLILAGLFLCVGVVLWISRRRVAGEPNVDEGDEEDRKGPKDPPDGADGDVQDPYLSALRDEYRS